jgi:hypothetical protein
MTSDPALETRLPMIEREQVSAEIAVLYDRLLRDRGVVPNMFKTLAHVPALVLGVAAFLRPLMGEGIALLVQGTGCHARCHAEPM